MAGKTSIDTKHPAAVSIHDYLDRTGAVDGRKLLDEFFGAPYGWSKDTTRYIIAALLIGGEIKLRVAGADVTVAADAASEGLKNNNNFNKVGVSLRGDSRPSPEALMRASDRLLDLTGESVVPVEGDIAKAVTKHFPIFQREYAALATKLKSLNLAGVDRAETIQDSIAEILPGDASESTAWLGGVACPLYDDLLWARNVQKAFRNGIDTIIAEIQTHSDEIAALPDFGVTGKLLADTARARSEAQNFISRDDFYAVIPDLQNRLQTLQIAVENTVETLKTEQAALLQTESNSATKFPRVESYWPGRSESA